MLPFAMTEGGSFTSDTSLAHDIVLTRKPDFFYMRNRTDWGVAANVAVESWWKKGMAVDTAQATSQGAGAAFALGGSAVTTLGFTFIDPSNPPSFSALTATTTTALAGTFVVSMASTTGLAVGDYVRLTDVTDAEQISGYTFQITAVTANVSITLGYMASSGITFAADGSAAQVQKFIPNRMYPRLRYIANITKATQAVIYFTEKNDFTPGEIVSFRVPQEFGMVEINNKAVRVLSVTNSATVSSITIDLDTSGFTTYAFPTSAIALAGVSPAVCVPSSSGVVPFNGSATVPQQPPGTNLLDAFDNRNQFLMHAGPNVIVATGKVFDWLSITFDKYTQE